MARSLRLRDVSFSATGLLIAVVSAATLAGAWFFQLVIGLVPCPLCLEQRIPYYTAIPLALLLAFVARDGGKAKIARLLLFFIAAILAYGAGLGTYHAGVEWGWWPGPTTCTGAQAAPGSGNILSQMRSARVVACDEVQWRFLGLSLAGYNVLIAGALSLTAFGRALRGAIK